MTIEDIGPLAEAVARYLGPSWSVRAAHGPDNRFLSGTGQELLDISAGGRTPGRVSVSGHFPASGLPYKSCEITVATARGAQVIAREINRRLLPVYRQRLSEVMAHNDREHREREARMTLAADVKSLFGDAFVRELAHPVNRTQTVFTAGCGAGGTVESNGDPDTVKIEIRQVPANVALRVLAALAESGRSRA